MLRRLNYKQKTDNREAAEVVKGVAKRVIVVKSPDPKVFEEAIFIVREDYMKTAGVTRSQLLARRAGQPVATPDRCSAAKKSRRRLSRHCQRSSAAVRRQQ